MDDPVLRFFRMVAGNIRERRQLQFAPETPLVKFHCVPAIPVKGKIRVDCFHDFLLINPFVNLILREACMDRLSASHVPPAHRRSRQPTSSLPTLVGIILPCSCSHDGYSCTGTSAASGSLRRKSPAHTRAPKTTGKPNHGFSTRT